MKDIPNYEGFYAATEDGQIYSYRAGKFLKQSLNPNGYMHLKFNVGGKRTAHRVHRLIASTFIPNDDNKPFVNHKDGVKRNNSVSNLEWVTGSENNIHALQTGLARVRSNTYHVVLPTGEEKLCVSLKEAAKFAGCSINTILNLVNSGRPGRNGATVKKVVDRRCND